MKMTEHSTLLAMLDLSDANTVNHNILLKRLNEKFWICGVALERFNSYLVNTEISRSPSWELFKSASVWTVVFHKCPVWAPCFLLSICIQAIHGCWGSASTGTLLRIKEVLLYQFTI